MTEDNTGGTPAWSPGGGLNGLKKSSSEQIPTSSSSNTEAAPSTSTPTPPTSTPDEPRGGRGFSVKGFFQTPRKTQQQTSQKKQQKPGKLGTVLLSVLMVTALVGAGLLAWAAFAPEGVDAPLPASEFQKGSGDLVGPDGKTPVAVTPVLEPGEDGEAPAEMSVDQMGPNTLFIPALGVYMPVEESEEFVSSHYAGFETIRVPSNPGHGVHYAGGAPMYGGDTGVTMIASHVSSSTGWGALRYLYQLSGGEMFYTADGEGQVQSWQLTQMRVEDHTEFPQEYWGADGERLLVVTTCGGNVNANRLFTQNIFAVAVPVDPKPRPPKSEAEVAADAAVELTSQIALAHHAAALAAREGAAALELTSEAAVEE